MKWNEKLKNRSSVYYFFFRVKLMQKWYTFF